MDRLPIEHPAGQYNVYVGYELFSRVNELCPLNGGVALVTDTTVGPLYAQKLASQIDNETTIITVPAGEKYKTLETVRQIYDEMFAAGLDRKATVVALGGGVINDVAGFAAATFMRGVDFVTCPTTLLSMVDASVGGKTGVDMPQGKNLVGAFKQPTAVIANLSALQTLPADEFAAGMAEVVKHGILNNPDLFRQTRTVSWWLEVEKQTAALQELVTTAIQVKRDVVQEDPFEGGRRALLNLGHTFGHAIEQVTEYRVKHGEGVGMGLVCAAHLSAKMGYCDPQLQTEIEEALVYNQLPIRLPADLDIELVYEAMQTDKKKAKGKLRFILPKRIGEAFITSEASPADVLETMRVLQETAG